MLIMIYYLNGNATLPFELILPVVWTTKIKSNYTDLGHRELELAWDQQNITLTIWNACYRQYICVFLCLQKHKAHSENADINWAAAQIN